ncbi:hypothetical protein APHAL10511_000443 [Amanita phalloides]|nr:hypothetical protein APHAL10511_000443 [Amanita phalloides]
MTSDDDADWFNPFQEDQESSDEDEEDTIPRLNTIENLRNGIIKTNQNKINEYTILLVGETGTGRTTFLSLIANILAGQGPEDYVVFHDEDNEAGGARNQSQTNSAKLYEFISKNDVKFRILDTPGLADTRGIAQDEVHKAGIAQTLSENIAFVNAVLIFTNGTVERLGAATDYALTALSAMFPRTLADNIGIVFTNVSDRLSWNFDQTSLPDCLRRYENNQFLLDNPVAKWKKVIATRNQKKTKKRALEEQSVLSEGHTKALRELALLFDWLDTLAPLPTNDITSLYEQSQDIERNIANALSRVMQLEGRTTELTEIKRSMASNQMTMDQCRDFEKVTTKEFWGQVKARTFNVICCHPQCHTNCQVRVASSIFTAFFWWMMRPLNSSSPCEQCHHPLPDHLGCWSLWEQQHVVKSVVDDEEERKFHEAELKNNEQRGTMDDLDRKIVQLNREVEEALASIGGLIESYATLSLMGSFAGQVKKCVRLLEINLEKMYNNKADPKSVELLEYRLETMKRKLIMVEEASEQVGTKIGRMMKFKEKMGQFVNSHLTTLARRQEVTRF